MIVIDREKGVLSAGSEPARMAACWGISGIFGTERRFQV